MGSGRASHAPRGKCPLLPNAMGRAGKETDEERCDTREMLTTRAFRGRADTHRDGGFRIRKPLLYPAELRDRILLAAG
jgi:hypothetical protein